MKNMLLFLAAGLVIVSCQQEKKEITPETKRPNILLIVADDLGFSDISPYGGNINTPVIAQFSKEGIMFSNFHVLPTCSPTRSALLTGNDNHVAGIGIMSEMDYPALRKLNLPGYSGSLSNQVVTIPELLRKEGYHTYMTGKWHLGEGAGENPYDRGFEETFILGTGGGSHWNDKKALSPLQHMEFSRNGKVVEPPEDFYSSKNYTDSLLQIIDKNKLDGIPFFGFLSFTAVHDPLHVPKEYIDKYKGKFDMGWDSLGMLRTNNLKALGLVPKDVKVFKNPMITSWDALPEELREEFARDMEVYAGMLEYMDMSIGRVFDYLKKEGLYDNTMIIFMTDNGANGAVATTYPGNEDGKYLASFDNKMENRGLQNSYVEMGPGWASAVTAPFRYFKSFVSEGGIKAPLIVKMPGHTKGAGQWNREFVHVTDLMPTILELTGVTYPVTHNGINIHPLIGKSILPVLHGETDGVHKDDGMGWELFEMKAYVQGKWKLLRLPQPFGSGNWELYDLDADPGETSDLAAEHQELTSELIRKWNDYAKHNELYDHKGHYDSLYRASFRPIDDGE